MLSFVWERDGLKHDFVCLGEGRAKTYAFVCLGDVGAKPYAFVCLGDVGAKPYAFVWLGEGRAQTCFYLSRWTSCIFT